LTQSFFFLFSRQYNALGGAAVLSFLARDKTVIAVTENATNMRVTAADLYQQDVGFADASASSTFPAHSFVPLHQPQQRGRVIAARSYAEAAGFVLAIKNGILFDALTPHVSPTVVSNL